VNHYKNWPKWGLGGLISKFLFSRHLTGFFSCYYIAVLLFTLNLFNCTWESLSSLYIDQVACSWSVLSFLPSSRKMHVCVLLHCTLDQVSLYDNCTTITHCSLCVIYLFIASAYADIVVSILRFVIYAFIE
jgi:hypothetical protein